MEKLSIVVPCFNEQETVPIFFDTVQNVCVEDKSFELEYLFVDDGSTDNTLAEIRALNKEWPNFVRYISFSRNFGKEAALYAGLKAATGDYVVVMDVDLQDPPKLLLEMLKYLRSGDYDCVGTRRINRKGEPAIRSFFARFFYRIINKISSTNIIDGARDYRMMTKQMVSAVVSMAEYNRFSKGLFSWVGFNTKYLNYENIERVTGKTSWSFWKLFKYSIDGITDFSEVPLSIASWTGVVSFVCAIVGMLFIFVRALVVPASSVSGWASMVCIILFIGGIQLLCLGIVGKYIGKIYLQSKNRPIYIVKESSK